MNDTTAIRLQRSLDPVLDKAIADRSIVGGVLLVASQGQTVYSRATGFADREARRKTQLDTIFRWSSLTKPVIATLTLALAERGTISLEDPVTRHLPQFRPRLPDGQVPGIKVRHLLSHTAGLTYGLFEPKGVGPYHSAGVSDGMDQPGLSIEENLSRIASVPLRRAPGSGWEYSVGPDVLGEYLARAAHTPLPELVRKMVTGPVGAVDSDFVVYQRDRLATAYADGTPEPVRMGDHHVAPFEEGGIAYVPDRMFNPGSYPSGGAGMSGTATDFLRLLEALRKGGAPVLSEASVRLLSTVKDSDFDVFVPGWKWPLGWSVLHDPSATGTPQSVGTWRWGGVYGNSWFVDPERQLSVVLLTNTAIAGMIGALPDAIRDATYAALPPHSS
jgi:CubicO group peptidase (beta-lactamase class C family)